MVKMIIAKKDFQRAKHQWHADDGV